VESKGAVHKPERVAEDAKRKIMRRLLLLIILPIVLCSCLQVYWVNPVSDVRNAVVDDELIGTWVGCVKISEKGETEATPLYLHIGKMDGKRIKLISQVIHPGSIEEGTHIMHISKLDGRRFMNIWDFTIDLELSNRYIISEYEIEGKDTLLLRQVNIAFVDNAIHNQVLLGNTGEDAVITSESSEIRKFIRNSPREQLFPMKLIIDGAEVEYCSFKRLNF